MKIITCRISDSVTTIPIIITIAVILHNLRLRIHLFNLRCQEKLGNLSCKCFFLT